MESLQLLLPTTLETFHMFYVEKQLRDVFRKFPINNDIVPLLRSLAKSSLNEEMNIHFRGCLNLGSVDHSSMGLI